MRNFSWSGKSGVCNDAYRALEQVGMSHKHLMNKDKVQLLVSEVTCDVLTKH